MSVIKLKQYKSQCDRCPNITEIQKIKKIILRDLECDRNPLKYQPHSKRYQQVSLCIIHTFLTFEFIPLYTKCINYIPDHLYDILSQWNHRLNEKPAINLLIPVERLSFIT